MAVTHAGAILRQLHRLVSSRALAEAAHSLGIDKIPPEGDVPWAEALADELIWRQAECGSWTNPAGAQREDDPLVATSMAMSALAICRTSLKAE